MRFAQSLLFLLFTSLIPGISSANPGDKVVLDSNQTPLIEPLQKRRVGHTEAPQTLSSFSINKFATGLGQISDMCLAEDGSLYTSDSKTGRIFRLADRDFDGDLDERRAVITNLDAPSGLATWGDYLFVADKTAIWQWDSKTQTLDKFVDLGNVEAGSHRPLLMREKDNVLWLGLTKGQVKGEIISIDLDSHIATKLSEGPGPLSGFSRSQHAPVWIAAGNKVMAYAPDQYGIVSADLEFGAQAGGVLLPDTQRYTEFSGLKDHIIVTQTGAPRMPKPGSGGQNILALPTQFGTPGDQAKILVDGFVSSSRRTAWGEPDKLALDERGLFFSDSWNGTLWRMQSKPVQIAAMPKPSEDIDIVVRPATDEETALFAHRKPYDGSTFKSQMVGSQAKGSQIDTASKIEVGSTIVKAWEEEQARLEASRDRAQQDSENDN